jgi:hypothetical protein
MDMNIEAKSTNSVWVLYAREIEKDPFLEELLYCSLLGVYTSQADAELALAKQYIELTEKYQEGEISRILYVQETTFYGVFQNPVRSIASDELKSKN